MARSKGNSAVGCITLIIIGGIVYLWSLSTAYGIMALVGGLVLICAVNSPKSCQLCGNQIKRDSYNWEIEGKSKRVCPKCNQTLERQKSKQATDKLLKK